MLVTNVIVVCPCGADIHHCHCPAHPETNRHPEPRIFTGTAPDGSTVTVDLDDGDGTCCDADTGPDGFGCTLNAGHPGPWHIADTGAEIVEVWPA